MQNSLKMPPSLSSAFLVLGYGERSSSPCRQRPNLPKCHLSRELAWQSSPLKVSRPGDGFKGFWFLVWFGGGLFQSDSLAAMFGFLGCACLITCTLLSPRGKTQIFEKPLQPLPVLVYGL
jgi:hypothetical protein